MAQITMLLHFHYVFPARFFFFWSNQKIISLIKGDYIIIMNGQCPFAHHHASVESQSCCGSYCECIAIDPAYAGLDFSHTIHHVPL